MADMRAHYTEAKIMPVVRRPGFSHVAPIAHLRNRLLGWMVTAPTSGGSSPDS